ncbi:MAG: tripartite tricarboxylate transporter TctB family protein [Chloroflexota bacterium]|nr:tripartite tricarboxylate transporter TctB family protein [Chloroflexota bacterium]
MQRAIRDVLAGLIFVAFGAAFAITATSYDLGTALRMGPGYFPLLVGGLTAFFGVLIIAKGLLVGESGEIGEIPWRAIALVVGAVLFFGFTVRGLGLVPAVFVTALMSSFASRKTTLMSGPLIAAGLAIVCVLVFVVALRLRVPLFGPWLGA